MISPCTRSIRFGGDRLRPVPRAGAGGTTIPYPEYATRAFRASSVLTWLGPLDRVPGVGRLSSTARADAQFRAMQAAILNPMADAKRLLNG